MLQQALRDAWSAALNYTEELFIAFAALQVGVSLASASGVSILTTVVQPFFIAGAFVVAYRALNDESTSRDQYIDAGKERYVAALLVTLVVGILSGIAFAIGAVVVAVAFIVRVSSSPPQFGENATPEMITEQLQSYIISNAADPVIVLVGVLSLLFLLLVVTVFEFAIVSAVIDKKDAGEALKYSYGLFKQHPKQIFGYTLFKEALAFLIVSVPSLLLPLAISENSLVVVLQKPSLIVLSSAVVIPTVLFVTSSHR